MQRNAVHGELVPRQFVPLFAVFSLPDAYDAVAIASGKRLAVGAGRESINRARMRIFQPALPRFFSTAVPGDHAAGIVAGQQQLTDSAHAADPTLMTGE